MHVKIQGGGNGVYANSGSCSAAAMYCEHERQQLMEKGMKPETFFHQHSDFISTSEVIDKIDHNKRHLRKEDAKFFVLTVSPSADEQRKMGHTLEERIAAFKNYIRNGVMSEYAKNFGRGLSADDIMYYAYVHVERGMKTDEQMHAHIIISRRNMDNSISLSPKSNHRSGKGIIAHGFNRDRFCNSCEKAFDVMMGYTRGVKESYEYLNAIKNGNYKDIASVTEKAMQEKYGIVSTGWDVLANAEFKKKSLSATKAPEFSPEKAEVPEQKTVVTETKVPEQQTSASGIIDFAKKAWGYATSIFGKKTVKPENEKTKQQVSVQELKPVKPVESSGNSRTAVDVYKDGEHYILGMIRDGKLRTYKGVKPSDADMFFKAKNDGNVEQFNNVCVYLENKYLKDAPEVDIPVKMQQQVTAQELKPVQPIPEAEKKIKVSMNVLYSKDTDSYSVIMYHGESYRRADNIEEADAARFMNDRESGSIELFNEVCRYLYGKYLKDVPEQKMPTTGKQPSTTQELKPVQAGQKKQIPDGLSLFKGKEKDYYSAALYKNGKRVKYADKIDVSDVSLFFKSKNSGDREFHKKVSDEICAQYFLNGLAQKVVGEFHRDTGYKQVSDVKFIRRGNENYAIRYKIDGVQQASYDIPRSETATINSLPNEQREQFWAIANSMAGLLGIGAGVGGGYVGRKDDDDEEKKKKRIKR